MDKQTMIDVLSSRNLDIIFSESSEEELLNYMYMYFPEMMATSFDIEQEAYFKVTKDLEDLQISPAPIPHDEYQQILEALPDKEKLSRLIKSMSLQSIRWLFSITINNITLRYALEKGNDLMSYKQLLHKYYR